MKPTLYIPREPEPVWTVDLVASAFAWMSLFYVGIYVWSLVP